VDAAKRQADTKAGLKVLLQFIEHVADENDLPIPNMLRMK